VAKEEGGTHLMTEAGPIGAAGERDVISMKRGKKKDLRKGVLKTLKGASKGSYHP